MKVWASSLTSCALPGTPAETLLAPHSALGGRLSTHPGSCPRGMDNFESHPQHPEPPPHPALFSLEALYGLQPRELRVQHLAMLAREQREVEDFIRLCSVELADRTVGHAKAGTLPEWFEEYAAELSDEHLRALITMAEERILELMSHRFHATAPAISRAALRWGLDGFF